MIDHWKSYFMKNCFREKNIIHFLCKKVLMFQNKEKKFLNSFTTCEICVCLLRQFLCLQFENNTNIYYTYYAFRIFFLRGVNRI